MSAALGALLGAPPPERFVTLWLQLGGKTWFRCECLSEHSQGFRISDELRSLTSWLFEICSRLCPFEFKERCRNNPDLLQENLLIAKSFFRLPIFIPGASVSCPLKHRGHGTSCLYKTKLLWAIAIARGARSEVFAGNSALISRSTVSPVVEALPEYRG